MTKEYKKMLGWMKASCIWSITTGVIALVLVAFAGFYAKYSPEPLWLCIVLGCLAVFGGMQVVDGLVRLGYNDKLKWTLEDLDIETEPATGVTDTSAKLHGRAK